MQVQEIMTGDVECVERNDSAVLAATKMLERDIGSLPVCDEQGHLDGIVTDRDITIRATANARDPSSTPVGEIMTPNPVYCFPEEDLEAVARRMKENQVRRVPVLDHDMRLTGILSLGDVAVEVGDDEFAGEVLEAISEPARPRHGVFA
jgi:CBS domain-containing protein